MVTGLETFRAWFATCADQYVLIGGTAASITLEKAGLEFRKTKDLDIVLHIETLTPEFGRRFWGFVEAGGYAIRQSSVTGRPKLFRFSAPEKPDFPFMLELFSRAPDGFQLDDEARLAPIPIDETVSSLSAILLDRDYYDFVMSGRQIESGLPWIGEDRLVPLKVCAWLDLTARRQAGEPIDSKDIAKHLKDVALLSSLFRPGTKIPVSARIADDMRRFIDQICLIEDTKPRSDVSLMCERLRLVYEI